MLTHSLILLAFPLVGLVFLVIFGLVAWGFTRPGRRVQPLAPPAGTPTYAPGVSQPNAWPSGRWNALISEPGSFTNLGAREGMLTLWEGQLGFATEGTAGPEWVVPCTHLRVSKNSMFTMNGADLRLEGPFGVLDLVVSQEHINRVMDNDFKDARERRYADEFAGMLRASGSAFV